jgi:hypothetical protein|tara:strand:+ start:4014 stop:4496 length:483 start_codon:yes stop_codon:yes gene_type:complete
MGVINVSGSTVEATVVISDKGSAYSAATSLTLLNLNDITLTNNQGTFRYQTLDSQSEAVVTTVATNSVALNLVIDEAQFFGDGVDASPVINKGIFGTSNDKTEVDFRIYFEGTTVTGNRYIDGTGFITGLTPTVNPGSPLWVTPVTLEVNGELTVGAVTP